MGGRGKIPLPRDWYKFWGACGVGEVAGYGAREHHVQHVFIRNLSVHLAPTSCDSPLCKIPHHIADTWGSLSTTCHVPFCPFPRPAQSAGFPRTIVAVGRKIGLSAAEFMYKCWVLQVWLMEPTQIFLPGKSHAFLMDLYYSGFKDCCFCYDFQKPILKLPLYCFFPEGHT